MTCVHRALALVLAMTTSYVTALGPLRGILSSILLPPTPAPNSSITTPMPLLLDGGHSLTVNKDDMTINLQGSTVKQPQNIGLHTTPALDTGGGYFAEPICPGSTHSLL